MAVIAVEERENGEIRVRGDAGDEGDPMASATEGRNQKMGKFAESWF